MCEFEWEHDNTIHATARCKYCGEIYAISGVISIPKYFWCLCSECKEKVIHNIPKRYKIKGVWRDFQSYKIDYKIKRYEFNESDIIIEKGVMEMENFTKMGTIRDWESWINNLPKTKGVYAIVNNGEIPHYSRRFLETGTCGHFQGRDPNVSIEILEDKWHNTGQYRVLYIGRSNYNKGHEKETECKSTIQREVKKYMRAGHGAASKWGGRYLWQLVDNGEFDVYYLSCDNPQTIERELIEKYKPFANLKGGDK